MRTLFLVVVSLTASHCTHSEPKPTTVSAPVPALGKPVAPVSVEAQLFDRRAKLVLSFSSPGQNVSVVASGLDGLSVAGSGSLLTEATVASGESRTFEVGFSRGAGRSHLAVSVRGTFNGATLARVVTFEMGEGPLQQNGTKVITDDGDALKMMQQ